MKKTILITALFVFAALNLSAKPYLFISHNQQNRITVVDAGSNKIVKEVMLPSNAKEMKLSPDKAYLYIASSDNNKIYRLSVPGFVLDPNPADVGYAPFSFAIAKDNSKIIVSNSESNNLSFIDLPAFENTAEPVAVAGSPRSIVITDDGRTAYIAIWDKSAVGVFNIAQNKMLGYIKTGENPWDMVIESGSLYVSNSNSNTISVIDLRTNAVKGTINTSETPRGMVVYNGFVYVNVMEAVEVFETAGYEKIESVKVNDVLYDMAFGKVPSGEKIYSAGYITAEDKGKIVVIDLNTNKQVYDIDMQGWPYYLEMEQKDKPRPTFTPTTPPAATRTATQTVTPTITPTITATTIPTAKPTKKPTKVPTPVPTATRVLESSTLAGKVLLGSSPLANTGVKAINKITSAVFKTQTDANGVFVFNAMPLGSYVVSVDALNIKDTAIGVAVAKGKNKELIIKVEKR